MFARPIAKQKAANAKRSTVAISPPGATPKLEHAIPLQPTTFSIAASQPWARPVGNGLNEPRARHREVDAARTGIQSEWPSWNFSKIPVFSPGDQQSQAPPSFDVPRFPFYAERSVGQISDTLEHETERATEPHNMTHELLRASGELLDASTRALMEPRFGHSFAGVRVHTGPSAAQSAEQLRAHAYTIGHDVVFGAGRFSPDTHNGRLLIAHELAHVVQNDLAAADRALPSSPVEALEDEARHVVASFRSGHAMPRITNSARDVRTPLRNGYGDPGTPTFGNLPRHDPLPGAQVMRLQKKTDGRWYEIDSGMEDQGRKATGKYDFALQNGEIWAVRSRISRGPLVGHTEAAEGGRVSYAGTMEFDEGSKLVSWTNDSGHYRSASSFAADMARALPKDWLPIELFKKQPPEAFEKVQLPVAQPNKHDKLIPRGRGGDVKRIGSPEIEPVPQKTTVSGEFYTSDTNKTGPPPTSGPSEGEPVRPRATVESGLRETAPAGSQKARSASYGADHVLDDMRRANQRRTEFNGRLALYTRTFFAYEKAITYLEAFATGLTVLAHGTALPEAERQADTLVEQSEEALKWAARYFGRPSVDAIFKLYAAEDGAALSEIAQSAGGFSTQQRALVRDLLKLSSDLHAAVNKERNEAVKLLALAVAQTGEETASNAIHLVTGDALIRVANITERAADNYGEAARLAKSSADDAEWIANLCNDMVLAGFHSLTPRCDFLGKSGPECAKERQSIDSAREAGRQLLKGDDH